MRKNWEKKKQKLSLKKEQNRKWFYSLSESGRRCLIRWWDLRIWSKQWKPERSRCGARTIRKPYPYSVPLQLTFNMSQSFANVSATHGPVQGRESCRANAVRPWVSNNESKVSVDERDAKSTTNKSSTFSFHMVVCRTTYPRSSSTAFHYTEHYVTRSKFDVLYFKLFTWESFPFSRRCQCALWTHSRKERNQFIK